VVEGHKRLSARAFERMSNSLKTNVKVCRTRNPILLYKEESKRGKIPGA
jgi:hypothetical protein